MQTAAETPAIVAHPSTPGPDGVPLRTVRPELGGETPAGLSTATGYLLTPTPEGLAVPPTFTPPPLPPAPITETTVAAASVAADQLTEGQVAQILVEAGAPPEWVAPFLAIAWCESKYRPGAVGDGGNSLGLFQLWRGWAPAYGVAPEAMFDPLVNARVAVYVRETRGRFGGGGGWTCATLLGIY